jgi:histidyl-tRNA synthetase
MKKLLILFVFVASCKPVTKVIEVPIVERVTDTIVKTQINSIERPIYDTIVQFVNIDDKCREELNTVLSTLNTSKTSGQNSYKIKYDKALKQLKTYISVNGSQKQRIETLQKSTKEKDKVIRVEVPIYTNVLKWWQKALMWCGGLSLLYSFKIGLKLKK